MSDLIARLQSAAGPSRELDAEIALANGWTRDQFQGHDIWRSPDKDIHPAPPRYTEFIDAAMTLTDGRRVKVVIDNDNVAYASYRSASIYEAATPAIALLIAICKAEEESKP